MGICQINASSWLLILLSLLLAVLAAGCGSDSCDSEGTYDLSLDWKDGTCGFIDTEQVTFTLQKSGASVEVTDGPGDSRVANFLSSDCEIRASYHEMMPDLSLVITHFILHHEGADEVVGVGLRESDMPPCSQGFSVRGVIQR